MTNIYQNDIQYGNFCIGVIQMQLFKTFSIIIVSTCRITATITNDIWSLQNRMNHVATIDFESLPYPVH